jgi:1-aminocyclopropane-1-carboxylate deaminase/D-cysteine desulfhydrase-like pyridoxal-dependent ACC family enzyme
LLKDSDLTPIQKTGNIWLKRDDLFEVFGVNGGKARACFAYSRHSAVGLLTAAARQSPQSVIVAAIASGMGLPCRIHTAAGDITKELKRARQLNAELIFHRPGYGSVIARRALDEAASTGWTLVPFGMECSEAVLLAAHQTANIPLAARRLVVPVGSGITLAGILRALVQNGRQLPVIGIVVGADPTRRLDKWAPSGWRALVELHRSRWPYKRPASDVQIGQVALDPIYEAKCSPYLADEDCLWIVGHRRSNSWEG